MNAEKLVMEYDPGFLFTKFMAENIHRPCMDIDQIVFNADYKPVGLLEVTSCFSKVDNPKFLAALEKRMWGGEHMHPQGRTAIKVATCLGVQAYWVAFDKDFEHFAIHPLDYGIWTFKNRQQFIDFVHSLPCGN